MKPIVIWGIGGQAREVAQLIADIEARQPGTWALQGFVVDEQATTRNPSPLPGPVLGSMDWWLANPDVWGVVAVGNPAIRRQITQRLHQANPALRFATLVHPLAWVAPSASLGQGSVVFAQSCVSTQVQVGQHASINLACTLSHDTVLGDCVSLGPGVHLCGGVNIGHDCELGAGVNVIPNVHIEPGVTVGAGAVVTRQLLAGVTAVGVPARAREYTL
jgi:sugar O-acyltransferase (sialic acid O-acetyltransferase NeuD family)